MGFLSKFKRWKSKPRAVVLGLDGVPYTLVTDLIKRGIMPNLGSIIKKGTLCQMDTTIPPISSVAWSTFMTGVNPAQHGIFGFMDLRPGEYDLYFPNFLDLKARTLWEVLSEKGKRSIVLNIPSTYPAKPLNGVLTSGFVALDLKKATYPQSAYHYLREIGYKLDVDTRLAKESLDVFVEDIRRTFDKRKRAILHFLESEDWDLFIGAITETDRIHHYFWHSYEDQLDPYHPFFLEFYKELDRFIGNLYDRLHSLFTFDNLLFSILSDHGFTLIREQIYLNRWLMDEGYLDFDVWPPRSLNDIKKGSKVFVLDPSRFYLHLNGRYPKGCIESGDEAEKLLDKIVPKLLGLTVDGRRVIKRVYRKEEVYSGSFYHLAPDLVAISHYGYDLKGAINRERLTDRDMLTGCHTQDDAFFFINRQITSEVKRHISDVAPIVLSSLS